VSREPHNPESEDAVGNGVRERLRQSQLLEPRRQAVTGFPLV
jgi:hypothetical protein